VTLCLVAAYLPLTGKIIKILIENPVGTLLKIQLKGVFFSRHPVYDFAFITLPTLCWMLHICKKG